MPPPRANTSGRSYCPRKQTSAMPSQSPAVRRRTRMFPGTARPSVSSVRSAAAPTSPPMATASSSTDRCPTTLKHVAAPNRCVVRKQAGKRTRAVPWAARSFGPALSGVQKRSCAFVRQSEDREFADGRQAAGSVWPSLGDVVERETLHLVVLEEHDHAAFQGATVAALVEINVVPAILIEDILDHRCPEKVAHLAAGHTDLQLIHGLAVEVIALLNLHAVHASRQPDTGNEQSEHEGARGPAEKGNQEFTSHGGPSEEKMRNNGRR